MLVTFIKFFIYIGVVLLYVFINPNVAIPFVITFFILYIAYTTFEITSTLAYSKKIEKTAS